ncbi:OmpA family protein [Azotobacter chroococcum]|uniref:OmpA family protein n=1 Tax=Azotobacter chroococcum TaxID=353 RepID=A0AA43Z8R4_9GAMM|nr:OmpA family protein [Azotobacter chroococcum]NHN78462.1 OmpA family protein [Azotobacter chroococcum]
MTEPLESPATSSVGAARKALLERQRQLEQELAQARQATHMARRQAVNAAREPDSEGEAEGWLITYLDMMTLLLVLLVVMLAFAGKGKGAGERSQSLKPLSEGVLPAGSGLLEQAGRSLHDKGGGFTRDPLQGLPVDQLGKDIEVVVKEGSVSFRISSEILFSSAQADLSLDGLRVLQQLVPVLNSSRHGIVVVGHTDALPIHSARFPSNWELSGARAGSVVRYLEANGVARQRMRAVGLADTQPLADNSTLEGRAGNRRVELVLETPQAAEMSED